jgi:peptidoglycan/LPS O-acetylase OafA/YrhL
MMRTFAIGTSAGPEPADRNLMPRAPSPRAVEIDGIRGWASLIVLLFHAFREMLRGIVPEVDSPLLAPLFASDLAVAVFFVLSGDALSLSFFHSGQPGAIDRLVVRRYFRLTVPILMSCLVTYLIMIAGLDYHFEAAQILGNQSWLDRFLHFSPSLYECLKYSLMKVYVAHTTDLSYNPFLWTMSIEMIGSMLVFLACYLWSRLKSGEQVCIYLVVGLTALGSFFSLFFAGLLFSHWRQRGVFERLLASRRHQYIALLATASCVAVYVLAGGLNSTHEVVHRLLTPILSIALVFCAYTQRRLKAFFSCAASRFLGVISFPLYLLQFQVLISLMSWLAVRDYAANHQLERGALLGFAAITVAVTIAAAWVFSKVERLALTTIDRHVLRILK